MFRYFTDIKLIICLCILVVATDFYQVLSRGLQLSQTLSDLDLLPVLKDSYLLKRKIDLSDIQWREFRNSMPLLTLVQIIFVGISTQINYNQKYRKVWRLAYSALFVGILHGPDFVIVVGILLVSYVLAKRLAGKSYGVAVYWTFQLILLILVQYTQLQSQFYFGILGQRFGYNGLLSWQGLYRLYTLKQISFAMDLNMLKTKFKQKQNGQHHEQQLQVEQQLEQDQSHQPLKFNDKQYYVKDIEQYDLMNYISYMLYIPLYIAGPIMTFSSFVAQNNTTRKIPYKQKLIYMARFLVCLFTIELLTHYLYFNSASRFKVWQSARQKLESVGQEFGPFEAAVMSFWVLSFIWIKFTVIWRYFRLFAMMDDIDPPENMLRCFCNNYTIQGFWRNWHASFNQWIVRYMYIPMGGSRTAYVNIFPIFVFVALWHDLEIQYLGWAFLMCFFFIPEMVILRARTHKLYQKQQETYLDYYVSGLLASISIFVLMTVNMVGFSVGLGGAQELLISLFLNKKLVVLMFISFFCAAQIMFYIRAREKKFISNSNI